jgi:hypothetical protein
MLLLSPIIIPGGRTHCFVWASTNVLFFFFMDVYWYLCSFVVVLIGTPYAKETTDPFYYIYIYIYFILVSLKKNFGLFVKNGKKNKKKYYGWFTIILLEKC